MDESLLWLNRLLKSSAEQQLDKDMTKLDFQQLLLYWVAVQIVDGRRADYDDDPAQRLMDYCQRDDNLSSRHRAVHQPLNYLINITLDHLDSDERLALFDALFYRVAAQLGVDRRHAEISAAFANGLARNDGLIELQAYSGEPFIVHRQLDRDRNKPLYRYTPERKTFQDLTCLRLVVHQIESESLNDQPNEFVNECLTLLDLPAGEIAPLDKLYKRLQSGALTGRTLFMFKHTPGAELAVLNELRQKLHADDLFEAAFEFTSYNAKGKPTPMRAWLLTVEKFHGRKTLYIDTRNLLLNLPGISGEQLAWFACAVCELWASPTKFRIGQFPQERLGMLQGLFGKYFHNGYRDVDGICAVHDSRTVLEKPFSKQHVPAGASIENAFSLLDKHQLVEALDKAGQNPLCAYIIGDNGAGKSLLLAALANHLLECRTPCAVIVSVAADRFPRKDVKDLYCYMGNKGTQSHSAQAIEKKLLQFLKKAFALPDRARLFEDMLELLSLKGRIYLAPIELFGQLPPADAEFERVRPLAQALNEAVPIEGMTLALSRKGYLHMARFNDLSSGEQQVLLLLGKVMASAGPGKVLLIDEPEISLHVRWQQLLPGCFSLVAHALQTRFVIATHSPTLIANAQDSISECFLAKKQQLFPVSPEERHSVETILLEGFETYTPHNREIAERCAALVAKAIREINLSEESYDDPQQKLQAELDELDEIMSSSGNPQDPRYVHDQQLIERAREAIAETFKFAQRV